MDLSVKPPKGLKQYKQKQPPYPHMENWLPARCLLTLPSGGGKQIIMLNLALKFWRGCFSRIILVSPTAKLDSGWEPLENYIRTVLKVPEEEPWAYDEFDEKVLEEILETQKKVVQYQKKHSPPGSLIYGILLLIDDLGSDTQIMKHSKLIDKLYTQGRHIFCSTIIAQQRWMMASSTQRSQATLVMYGKPRSELDFSKFAEENSALAGGKKNLEKMINLVTSTPYGFITIDMLQQDPNKRFLNRFSHYLQVE
jgi:hypothetical protein